VFLNIYIYRERHIYISCSALGICVCVCVCVRARKHIHVYIDFFLQKLTRMRMCHILTGMPWAMDSFFSSFFCCLSDIYRALASATLPRLHRYFFLTKILK